MKKFGFGRKDKNKDKTAASNPYAQPVQDPYANGGSKPVMSSYDAAKQNYNSYGLPSGPGAQRPGYGGAPNGAAAAPDPSPQPAGYASEKYGNGGGYGTNRYDNPPPQANNASRYGPGGYGGMGSDPEPTSAPPPAYESTNDRYGQRPGPPTNEGSTYTTRSGATDQDSGYGGSGSYAGYGEERELTAEEIEEAEVNNNKAEIRRLRKEGLDSTERSLQLIAQAEETGRATLARLGAQGERLYNTERSLDAAASHNRVAEEKAKELKTLNKSMFAVHVANPFTSNSRRAERDRQILEQHQAERNTRDQTREEAWGMSSRMEKTFRELDRPRAASENPYKKQTLEQRSQFLFEAESEDEADEDLLDDRLKRIHNGTGTLHRLAKATGEEIDHQNSRIDGIIAKSDQVDDQIAMNRARLDRIH